MPSPWIDHIKEFARTHNISYGCALSNPDCKASYHANKPQKLSKKEKKEVAGMEAEDINRAGEPFKKPVAKKVSVASKVLDNPDLMKLIEGYIPSKKTYEATIDGDRYYIKGDKIARQQTGIIITDKKLVARLFKKLSAQRIAIANNKPIPEKKTRKPSKAQEEKASKEYMRRYNAMREDTAQGGL